MSNLAIQQNAPDGMGPGGQAPIIPPGLEHDFGLIRNLPLFEGVPNQDLIAAMQQGGVVLRHLERDMFVLDPIGLASGQPAPVIYIARGQVSAAVFQQNVLSERRAAQVLHEQASTEELEE
ncbi:hypothetical protein BH11MYX1_BH11MYX1_55880 [soil metagenome]